MRIPWARFTALVLGFAVVLFFAASVVNAQSKVPTSAPGKTVLRDSDGNLVSNNEFADIRMANFHYPDATVIKAYEDGTVEFRLQKVPQEGMLAPKFSVRTVEGKTLTPEDLNGKVVVLSFWFIGCPACRDLEPKLNEFKAKFIGDDGIVFLAMTADSASDVKKYLAKERFDYLQGVEAKDAMRSFVFAGYPKNIVIGKTGEIVYWRSIIRAWDKFEAVVRTELGKNAGDQGVSRQASNK